jgi:hypothetical protein
MDSTGPIDMHLHLVGNGLGGSGCWLRIKRWQRPFAGWMARQIGLSISLNDPDWDRVYPAHLAGLIR